MNVNWEALGVVVGLFSMIAAMLAIGLPVLSKLSACVANLQALKEQWSDYRAANDREHRELRGRIDNHEHRISVLEA